MWFRGGDVQVAPVGALEPILVERPLDIDAAPQPEPKQSRPNPVIRFGRSMRAFWFGQVETAPICLLRIVYGGLLILWLAQFWPTLDIFFTDEGILPRSELIATHGASFSVLLSFGEFWQVALFWCAAMAVAVLLAAGYRTRLMCLLAFLAVISFQARNPLILDGSDFVFKLIPFWMMFTAAGERYSIDAWLKQRRGQAASGRGWAFPIRILEVQLAWIYLCTGLEKAGGSSWLQGTAMYYVLQLSHNFTRPFMAPFAFNPGLVRAMTWETLAVELAFMPLILFPGPGRVLAVASSAILQIGILTTMNVGNFPLIMLGMLVLFLPPSWVVRTMSRLHWPAGTTAAGSTAREWWRWAAAPALALTAVAALATALPQRMTVQYGEPTQAVNVMYFAGLDQSWQMFAPSPSNLDWWVEAPAQLSNGAEFDLFTHQAPDPNPHDWGLFYTRWTKVMDHMSSADYSKYLLELGRGFCRTYNNHLAPGQPVLETFQLKVFERWIQPPGKGPAKMDERTLWTHHCF